MSKRFAISILSFSLALAGLAPAADLWAGAYPQAEWQSDPPADPPVKPQGQVPSDEEIRARAKKLMANQHSDDEALELYERVERHIDRTGGIDPRTLEDRTYRIVPTGGGNQKIVLKDEGKPVDPAAYNRQLRTLAGLLATMADPNNPKTKAALAKREKRQRERAEFLDAMMDAFLPKWVGSETWNGHACDVIELNPNPNFRPRSMFQDALSHVNAKIWVDHDYNQMARGEARVTSDISFGGGILGKLYRGGIVSMEQAEVAPGVWLPTRYQYDFSGRKFLFAFQQHQVIEVIRYRRVGRAKEALQIVQNELASGKTFDGDP
jgi:hypothetical protein